MDTVKYKQGLASFSIVTNACATDDIRIIPIVESWLRVFGNRVKEILIIIDNNTPSGRIARLHGDLGSLEKILAAVQILKLNDSRVKSVMLPHHAECQRSLSGWFAGAPIPHRCQAGTPVLPFVYAMEQGSQDLVLRVDCDMVFYENGFLENAFSLMSADGCDLLEPFRWDQADQGGLVSTRALFFSPAGFKKNCLPLRHAKLDIARSVHRLFKGLPREMALETTLSKEKINGKIRHSVMNKNYGWSLHFGKRSDFLIKNIEDIIKQVEAGNLTNKQITQGPNFIPDAWL